MMELRPYQEEARAAVHEQWDSGVDRTLLVLPTASGKTIVFSKLIEDVVGGGGRALVLAHRGELLDQAADKLEKVTGLRCAVEKAEESCLDSWFRVVVGSVQTLQRPTRLEQFDPDYFDAIIVDEAHHVVSESYQRVLEHFSGAKVLGVTATPDRGDMRNLGSFFESLAYEYSLPRAIKDGFLCRIEAQTIPLKLDLTGVGVQAGDFKAADIGSALDPYLVQIADEMLAAGCADRKTVVFLPLIATSQKFRGILEEHGFAAAEVNGESSDRAAVLSDFDAGRTNVLCNSMLLTEGWDCPSVDCIVVLRPTKIRSLYCLDTKTEVLTRDGWKTDVAIGEDVAAFERGTGAIRYTPALATVRRQLEADEYFCSISGPSTDIRVTNKHRMLYDNKRRKGWKFAEAEYIAGLKDGCYLPVSGNVEFEGVPLTDGELRFIGWVMTDGTINRNNNAITISQGEHQPYLDEIEGCIKKCGFKFTRRTVKRRSSFNSNSDLVMWTISKGKPRGTDKHLTGWGRLEPYLSKDLHPNLYEMTSAQFAVMLEAINNGDGRKNPWVSYHISKGNRTFIDRLQTMAIQRGYRASVAIECTNVVRQCDLYTLHIKKQAFSKVGAQHDGRPSWVREPHKSEICWCVENEIGTLITRRNGKVAIVGNCQMVGRGTRLCPGKDELLLLDFLWHTEAHELCHPAHLIAESADVAAKMTEAIEEAGCPVDLQLIEIQAESDTVADRERALADKLAEMKHRKRKLVDPLQFEMSIQAEDLASYVPAFGWEMAPPSDKQVATLEKLGIMPDEIECAGKASKLLDRLSARRSEGLTTPKQIHFLEAKGFNHVGTWEFEAASKLISRISANGWRVPRDIDASTYAPAPSVPSDSWEVVTR